MSARGFSLIELLVAGALFIVIGGAVAALAGPLRVALTRADASAQLEPLGRAALETLAADIREAGGDAAVIEVGAHLAQFLPRVLPLRDLESNALAFPGGAVRVLRVPRDGAQGLLAAPAASGSAVVSLDTTARCASGPPACGFVGGTAAVLYNAGAAEAVIVAAAGAGTAVLSGALASPFAAGAALAETVTTTYGTRRLADGSRQLVRVSNGGAEQPIIDNVVDFEVSTDTADVFRIERVTVHIRLESPSATLRGPVGYFFRRAGTAVSAAAWLPDAELRFTIALRNSSGPP